MKIKAAVIVLITILSASSGFAQLTTLKEYGLKGKIESIITLNYFNVKFYNGKWAPLNDSKYDYLTEAYFNRQGNMDSIRTLVYEKPAILSTMLMVFHYKNGQLFSGKFYPEANKEADLYVFK